MGFFDFLKQPDINAGIEKYKVTAGAVLLDVRTPAEYREGHIPGSTNLPLQEIDRAEKLIDNKDTPVFVHCRSGARSRTACGLLRKMGYTDINDIGGIADFEGKVEK